MKILLFLMLFPMLCQAQQHRFFDKANIALHSLATAAMTADLVTTRQALAKPNTYEAGLVKNQSELAVLKVAILGSAWLASYGAHKTGHHKFERWIPVIAAVPSGIAAAHNATVR